MLVYPGVPEMLDLSHWQGKIAANILHSQGVKYAIVKCTDGSHGQDARYRANVESLREVGIKVGSYHFMRSTMKPEDQAENFIKHNITTHPGDIVPMMDAEWDMKGKHDRWQDVGAMPRSRGLVAASMLGRFLLLLMKHYGNAYLPILYTGSWWTEIIGKFATSYANSDTGEKINFGDCPLMLAAYTKNFRKFTPLPWAAKGAVIHQYSGTGRLNGIGTLTKEVDFDKLLAPIETLLIPGGSGLVTGQTLPTPTLPPVIVNTHPPDVIAETPPPPVKETGESTALVMNPAYLDDLATRHDGLQTDPGIGSTSKTLFRACQSEMRKISERSKKLKGQG